MAIDAQVLETYALQAKAPAHIRIWRSLFSFVRKQPLGAFGGFTVILLILMSLFPGFFAHADPNAIHLTDRNAGPSGAHWFGTDNLGRDFFARIVYGARISVQIGFGVVFLSATFAAILGLISGYFGGVFDMLVQRLVDIGISLPGLIFIILVITSVQQVPLVGWDIPVLWRIVVSLGVLQALGSSRIIRGATISTRQNQYVEASRVVGASDARIIVRHLLPNVFPVILISASIQIGGAVLIEASLSFLGYGVPPPQASWGRMLNDARAELVNYPHLAIFPGLAIFFAVFSFNMFGDGLRDVLDPRLRGSR